MSFGGDDDYDENYVDENDNDDMNYSALDYSDSSPLHLAVTKLHLEVVKVMILVISL